MASIDVMKPEGTRLVIVREMPQSTKKFILRSPPSFVNIDRRSAPQLKAEIALSEFAIQHRGDFGTVQMPNGTVISKIAFDLGTALRGQTHGGLSYSQRLAKHQAGAQASLDKLKRALAQKAGMGSGRSFMGE